MIAIDDFNLFHEPVQDLWDPDFQKMYPDRMHPRKMTLARLFMNWETHGLVRNQSLAHRWLLWTFLLPPSSSHSRPPLLCR